MESIATAAYKDFPFWWLYTDFGVTLFVLFFLTWGLVIVNLAFLTLLLVRKLFGKKKEGEEV